MREDIAAVRRLQGEFDVLLHKENSAPGRLREFSDHRKQGFDDHGGETQAEFVEQKYLGSASQGPADGQHLLFAP